MIPKFRAWYTPFKGKKFGQEMIHGRAGSLISHAEMSPDKYVLMQSTGLKDKNGVEIFEGYSVKPERGEPFIVKHFVKGQGVIKHVDISTSGHLFEGIYSGEELEVIGNVWENPELLEEEK